MTVLAVALLLSACGSRSGTSGLACTQQYWNGQVGTCLPAGWSVVPREKLDQKGIPPEVIVAFQRDKPVSGQTPTVLITHETLTQNVDPAAYSQANIRAVSAFPGYTLIDQRDQTIDGQKVQIHIYTAQPNADEPAHRFYQLSTSTAGHGYSYTGTAPVALDTGLQAEILLILQNATLTAPSSTAGSTSSKTS